MRLFRFVLLIVLCFALAGVQGFHAPRQATSTKPGGTQNPKAAEWDELYRQGNEALAKRDWKTAEPLFQKCLALAIQLKDEKRQGASLNRIGNCYHSSDLNRALDYYTRSLAIREKIGLQEDVAASLYYIGNVHKSLRQYDQVLDYWTRSLAILEKSGEQLSVAISLSNIGTIYTILGKHDSALDYYTRSLSVAETLGNQGIIATSIANIGTAYLALGQHDKALDYHLRSLAIWETVGKHSYISVALGSIGADYAADEQYGKALDYYARSLAMFEKVGNQGGTAANLLNTGRVHFSLGQYDKAIEYFTRSLAIRETLANQRAIALCLNGIGSANNALGQYDKANEAYLKAMRSYESVSLQVGDPSEVGSYQAANQGSLYANYAELQVERGLPAEALALAERGRAQGLLRQSLLTEVSLASVLGPENAKSLEIAQDAVATAAKALRNTQHLLEAANENSRPLLEKTEAEQKAKLSEAESKYSLLRDALLAKNEGFRDIVGRAEVSGSGQRLLQLGTRNPETLFIEYSLLDDKALAFVLAGKGGLKVVEFPLPAKELKKAVDDYLSAVQNSEVEELKLAKKLYAMLLGPLEKERLLTDSFKNIAIVGEGDLLEIPFAALANEKGERLIERCSVSNLVSLSSLFWRITARDPEENMLSIADTTGQGGEVLTSATRGGFAPLPEARKEGIRAWRAFPDSKCLIGEECKEAAIKEEITKYSLLHFACHGTVNSKLPMRSALAMAPEKADSKDDGFLEAQEIVGLPLSAQLAVLSACHTGEGLQSGGEGLMGLAWAFRAAGVPAIVASKWEVDDAATGRIMAKFYEELKKGARKDDALRTAMLAEMKYPQTSGTPRSAKAVGEAAKKRSNAYYWAAFQVIGDPKPLQPLPKK